MKVLLLANEKGGIGKTTCAVHAACGLAARGRRVLLIDGDPQGHATIRVGLRKAPKLYDLLVRDAEWNETTVVVSPEKYGVPGMALPSGKLWVVPSNVETRNIASSISDADTLALRLTELDGQVDVVIIDTSPTPSLLHGVFYSTAHAILYPTKLTYTSFDGLVESLARRAAADATRRERWGMPPINVAGIIPMDYRSNTREQSENLGNLRAKFGEMVWEPIPQSTLWTESESRAAPVYSLEPSSDAAMHCWELVDRFEEVIRVQA